MGRRFTRRRNRNGVLMVSDHALLRFMQRAGGVDIEALRAAIAASLARAVAMGDRLDAVHYRIVVDGLVYVVRNNVVATVLVEDMPRGDTLPAPAPERAP